MTMQIRLLGPGRDFFGEGSGIDLTKRLTPEEIAAMHSGMGGYAALVFHDQNFTKVQQLCDPLICEHSRFHSRAKLGFTLADYTAEDAATIRPVRQQLVRVHPSTGRKSLYLSAHAGKIVGWPEPEAKAFLLDLTEHATQR